VMGVSKVQSKLLIGEFEKRRMVKDELATPIKSRARRKSAFSGFPEMTVFYNCKI
jgi:hypothetical protein